MAVVASVLLLRQRATPPAPGAGGASNSVLKQPGVDRGGHVGELFAYSGWAGALVYVGALLVETYELSIAATGLALGFGALVYVPGNFLFRRWVDRHSRRLLVGLALVCGRRPSPCSARSGRRSWVSVAALRGALASSPGGRTLAGSARGLGLAPELRLGVTGVRTAALQTGYFVGPAVGGVALALGGWSAARRRLCGPVRRRSDPASP